MDAEINESPLVTLALFAFNQEKFINEAVAGAFAQTYSPLEIILSDDSSTDRTFEIMRSLAADYRGPHTLILNRNEQNLGIAAHLNRVMDLSHGALIVASAGDDISLPSRISKLCAAWEASDRKHALLSSGFVTIDEYGQKIGEQSVSKEVFSLRNIVSEKTTKLIGCVNAWTRPVFAEFGPLFPCLAAEDFCIVYRAALLGSIGYVDEPLVRYRLHSTNVSTPRKCFRDLKDYKAFLRRIHLGRLDEAACLMADAGHYLRKHPDREREILENVRGFISLANRRVLRLEMMSCSVAWLAIVAVKALVSGVTRSEVLQLLALRVAPAFFARRFGHALYLDS